MLPPHRADGAGEGDAGMPSAKAVASNLVPIGRTNKVEGADEASKRFNNLAL